MFRNILDDKSPVKVIGSMRLWNISDGEFIADESWIVVAQGQNGLAVTIEQRPGITLLSIELSIFTLLFLRNGITIIIYI